MSKIIRISSGTEEVLEKLKNKLEEHYKFTIGLELDLKEDNLIKEALQASLEKANKLL